MSSLRKVKSWFNPMTDFADDGPSKKFKKAVTEKVSLTPPYQELHSKQNGQHKSTNVGSKNWLKTFNPVTVDDLAVHHKKVQEIDDWLNMVQDMNTSNMLLLTGPVGCGKTITVVTLAAKYHIKITEWITPLDIEMLSDKGEYEFKEKQSTQFLDFIIKAANFTSLLDNNSKKIVLVEDFPNTFIRTPSEFTEVLHHYKVRAKSPIVFICSESHTDSKNTAANLFTPSLKEQFGIHHVSLNSVSVTGLRLALKRVADIINKEHTSVYNPPTTDMIECVVNSSSGDVRSAVMNLHFACLKGAHQSLETSIIAEKETKSKTRKKKQSSSKFSTIGKDQTVSILHGVGRVLNPKMILDENGKEKLTHSPDEIIEQFLTQPNSFINFLQENYLPHYSSADHVDKAASALSDADIMLAEWREKMCQDFGLYTSVAGLMLSNKAPVSAWNPVRGPKNMKIQYPNLHLFKFHPYRSSDSIRAIFAFEAAALKSEVVLQPNQSLRFFNQEWRLRPTLLFPAIFCLDDELEHPVLFNSHDRNKITFGA